jgi:DegV family protein with EDD domain
MPRVAIVTDSASDLSVEEARDIGVTVVPLIVSFGDRSYLSGVDMSTQAFYERLLAPGAPFPTTAACSPIAFERAFRACIDAGADAVVCITISERLSATFTAARMAGDALPPGTVVVIDSQTVTACQKQLVVLANEAAALGASVDEVLALVERRRNDTRLFVVLETLEYVRRGGRISAAQAAIGSMLSVKPIITVEQGVVETVERPRTQGRARARLMDLLTARPIERMEILHTQAPGVAAFADELCLRAGIARDRVDTGLIGSSVAPHVGPGAYGAALLLEPAETA